MEPVRRGAGKRKSGDFAQAVLEHLDALYGYAMSLTRNPAEAEDLVQETCLRAIRGAQRAVPTGDRKAWLFTILRNIWINQYRRRTRGPEFLQLVTDAQDDELPSAWVIDSQERPDILFERKLLRESIRLAIENLPEMFREVIVLRCIEGFSYTQIAEILGCPSGTVMSRLSRARAELRRQLDKVLPPEQGEP
jgi:RNA polymerase sigma-70 factor (ECF subfamily)